jgi:hypothetical protein
MYIHKYIISYIRLTILLENILSGFDSVKKKNKTFIHSRNINSTIVQYIMYLYGYI